MSLGPSFWRRLIIVFGVLVTAAVLLVVLVHAPFSRAAALRYAVRTVEEQYDLHLDASRLDYNLAALRIGLADLRVSALHATDEPFITADYLSVMLPWRTVVGDIAFNDITVTNGRVFVRRREDGTSNLPAGSEAPAGEPPALRVEQLNVPQLAIDLRDEQAAMFLSMPSIALRLTPGAGYVKLGGNGQFNTETQITHISELAGNATFDGRALHLDNLQVRADEGSARLNGSITLLASKQAVNLTAAGTLDATRAARWAVTNGDLPRGALMFEAHVAGTFDQLDTQLSATSERLAWQNLAAANLETRARITTDRAEIDELRFEFEGGRATARASVPFDPNATGRVSANWAGIDAAAATRTFAPEAGTVPASHLSGELNGEGTGFDAARWSGKAQMTMTSSGNGPGRVGLSGEVSLELRDSRWRLAGRHRVGGVVPVLVTARGSLDRTIEGTAQVEQTDLPALIEVLRVTNVAAIESEMVRSGTLEGDIRVAGELGDPNVEGRALIHGASAPQFDAPLVQLDFSGRPLQPQLSFRVEAANAVAVDQPLRDLRAAGRLTGMRVEIDELSASQPSTSGLLSGSGTYDLGTNAYTATLQGAQWMFAPTADRPLAGSVDLSFSGEGTVASPRGTGKVTLRDGMWGEITLGSLDASVELDGQIAHVQAQAPEFATSASGRIEIRSPYQASIDANVQELDLSRVLKYVSVPTTVAGTTTLTVHAELPLEAWRTGAATVDVASLKATAGDLPVELAGPARVRYEDERAHIDRLDVVAGALAVSASGALPVFEPAPDEPAALMTVTGNVDDVVRTAAALGLTELPVTGGDGPVALLSRVTGTVQQPVVSADLEVGPASVALENAPAVTGLTVRAHAENGWVELREASAEYESGQLSATGRAPLSMFSERLAVVGGGAAAAAGGDVAVLMARATNITPAVLAPFVAPGTLDELSGTIDATLEAATPTLELADLTGELRIDRFDVRLAELPVTQSVPTRIVARDGVARVESWEWIGQGTTLTVRGQVGLEDRQAALMADGTLDLRLLTPFVRAAGMTTAGRLEPRLSITGSLDSPRLDGDVVVTDGELRLADPRVIVSDLSVRTVLTGTTARITELTGSANGGAITGGGTVEYASDQGLQAQLSTGIRGMAVEYPEGLRSELDADLNFTFRAPPATSSDAASGKLSGTVTVLRGAYREPMAVMTQLLATLRAQQLAADAESSPFLDALALDIRVITDEDILVDNNYGRLQLGADLRLVGTAQTPGMSGRAELREGGQLFVGRNVYAVDSGTIDFSNPVAIEPVVNVRATTRAGGEDIEVTITGPAESPSVALRSTSAPELGQAEVASLLLTGRPLENLAPDDAAFIGTQVLGNFSGEVLGFASRAVGLDTIRLGGVENQTLRRDPTEIATTKEDPTNRITFGKNIAPNLDLTFSQSLRDSDAQTWIIDYLPLRGLGVRVVSDDADLRSYGLRHDIAFGTRAPAIEARPPERPTLRVATVDVSGDLALPEMRVRATLRLRPGEGFDFAEWQADRDRLENLYRSEGYFTARVMARRMAQGESVALAYEIAAGPRTVIAVTGIDLGSALRSRLETAWFESVFDEFLIDEATQAVREDLAGRGYLQSAVNASIRNEGSVKTLDIVVEPGPRSTRTIVRIEGVAGSLADEIATDLDTRDLDEQAISNPEAVAREVEAYLRRRGYVRVQVATGMPLFAEATATLPVNVDSGPLFTIARVELEGAPEIPEDRLREALTLDPEVPYDPDAVEAARSRLVAALRREGFATATVTVRANIDIEQPQVPVTFVIGPGPRQVLSDIVIVGNRAIDSDVILRAVDLPVNEPLRAEEVLQARTRVFETGLFRRIDITSEPGESTRGDDVTPMRIRVTVEEWPAVRLRYGFVVAEERPEDNPTGRELSPGFSADLTRRTLFGRAITIGTALGLQRREQGGRVFGNAPTFLGLPIESSLVAERSRQEIQATSLVMNQTSVTWEQRARVATHLGLSYSYSFERNHTFDTRSLEDNPLAFDIKLNTTRWNTAGAWDTRNDPLDSARGMLISSSLDYGRVGTPAEAALSSDTFVRELVQAYYFRAWRSVVSASAARWGLMLPLGGSDVFRQEMFFAGGSRTVRGVPENSLGPRSIFDPGEPAGGQTMIVLNQEMRMPIYRWVGGVTFIDAGNVFAKPRDASLRDLVGSIGFGLRVSTPFALLRVDYGKVIWGMPEPGSGRWTFGIGQIF
jgi:outer membrane protein assembly factor BamA/autotransporter translocation and assembly factor TamB